MRGYEKIPRRPNRVPALLALATVGLLLALACPAAIARPMQAGPAAAAKPSGDPVRFWSLGRFDRGAGAVTVASDSLPDGTLRQSIEVAPATFDFQPPFPYSSFLSPDKASAGVFSSADGAQSSVLAQAPPNRANPGEPDGTFSNLDEYQAYVKRARNASLQVTLSDLQLRAVDTNGQPDLAECARADCTRIKSFADFQVRAYAASAGGDFFRVGGAVYLEGHQHVWRQDPSTLTGSFRGLWGPTQFTTDLDADHSHTGAFAVKRLNGPITLNIPLNRVHRGELFAVHVSLGGAAVDDRGGESGAQAFIQDPHRVGPALRAQGLEPRGAPRFKEPPVSPRPAASCPAGPRPHAGTVQFRHPTFSVGEDGLTPMVLVTRTGGSRGAVSVTVETSGGTARSGIDFQATRTRVRFENGDTSPRLVEIPIREDRTVESPEDFTVSLSKVQCATLGQPRRATVTIIDDDQAPPPPPPTFTIGGTVDGLQGSGLVLGNPGTVLQLSGNGRFTFPGTFPAGSPLDVRVQTQPTNPDQVCTVVNGTGTITADVTNVAVHCTLVPIPAGLDTAFGSGGRVTTPITGEGRAVLIQPNGGIVTVGPRDVGNFRFDFAATRHDNAGNLDPTFGVGGVATTDLGGNDDKARDAALLPDGGFVAVGQADPSGLANTDFGIARYTPDGQPSPAFPAGGFVTTDLSGRDDAANAVAVQPDGKIVAAGFTLTTAIDFDFALVRYNPDGTLDHSFGANGVVATDLGSLDDAANGVAIQSDGKIVAVGVSGENVALARYLPDGKLDPTFNGGGTAVSDLGFDDVANGVAITPGGTILVAGTRLGAHINLDAYVASYGPSGRLNLGFGTGGVASADLSGGDDFGDDLALDASGDIIVVGSATSTTVTDMALVRFKPDGTVAASLTTDFHGTGDFGHALAIDAQGRIVAAGSTGDQFGLMRASL